jgi:triosephosphate isomerase
MHKTASEAASLAQELLESVRDIKHRIMIAPPFTALERVRGVVKGSNMLLGAQNMCAEEKGAHTGEVSVLMLKDIGVDVIILGHSERRHIYGESDELINRKVKLALNHGLEVVLCVGETIEEREAGKAEAVVTTQIKEGLEGVSRDEMGPVTVAYEPVWAIGTGKTATPEDADAMHLHIRRVLSECYDTATSDSLTIQYGGSVKPGNIKALMAKDNIDGALVGGASLTAENFIPIVRYDE